VPPGSLGLVLQPYWSPGMRCRAPRRKGAVIGFGDVHTRAHLYRAILEGLAYALREGGERTARRSGVAHHRAARGGRRLQSERGHAAHRRYLRLPATRPHVYEASGLGAAIDAAVSAL
jgi:sugar (pentulose or hexulose) kinase